MSKAIYGSYEFKRPVSIKHYPLTSEKRNLPFHNNEVIPPTSMRTDKRGESIEKERGLHMEWRPDNGTADVVDGNGGAALTRTTPAEESPPRGSVAQ